ncbi:AraC family transcriptional regulator [Paenibacillus sp. FSL R7-277]|uniref:helix-turn-helix transcriptional regulator n=1 Tax=Paenibacillus sp. FSL R7-277 TaxID=1227352 RepID=UPI0003E1BD8B|nr:helix-turn-helix domain-containing protein [Paenibacillus sp. FSL R7-277]ETT76173.1 AraC family transcriptional regulator [Paenibacillus sp. FSL R7-277]
MPKLMDYMISPYPVRIIDPKVEAARLRLQSIRVGQAGHLPGRTLFRSGVTFEHWALVYIVAGAGTYTENGGPEQQVHEGSLFFFRPGYSYSFGPPPGGYWDEYYINFSGSRVTEWLEAGMIAGGEVTRGDKAEGLKASFEKVLAYMAGDVPGDADRAALLLEEMLLECSLQLQGSRRPWRQEAMPLIREALNACIYEQPDLPGMAGRLHLSMSTLRRTVRRSSGYPLHEYIHRLKMAEAKHLLLNTSLQVQEIAGMLHYRDSFYFSRLFKKYMGLSPQTCRNHL